MSLCIPSLVLFSCLSLELQSCITEHHRFGMVASLVSLCSSIHVGGTESESDL